jgi:opacity protein-like surface antigen
MKSRLIVALLVGGALSVAVPASAQNAGASWFAGVGVSRLNVEFRPYYTYYAGGEPDEYVNKADGVEVEVLAGRRHRLSDRFSLTVQGSAAFNGVTWELSIPEEPAELEYSLPYRFALSVAPEVHFGRMSVYADLGGGLGRVRQLKTSPDSSTYDVDRMRPTLNIGAGIKVSASSSTDVYAHVGHVRHSSHEFDSFTPSGVLVEHVKDSPRATSFTFGLIRRF